MSSEVAIHSDLLVHWTGKDIDSKLQPEWWQEGKSQIPAEAVEAYLARLRDVLRYGLWLTDQHICPVAAEVLVPAVPCVCFTELKLSQSQVHARRYGRLGIAVKRPFVFKRDGRPVVYFEPKFGTDAFFSDAAESLRDKRLVHFFKPMSFQNRKELDYGLYSECEWRIVASAGPRCRCEMIDPRNTDDRHVIDYFGSLPAESQDKLKYLMPLDAWHAGIIYPTLEVKKAAQEDGQEIRALIREVAARGNDVPDNERGNLPVELDLNLCKNL